MPDSNSTSDSASVYALLVIALLGLSAQKATPNAPPSTTTEGSRSIGKLDSQKKTDKSQQAIPDKSKETPCTQCLACPPIEQTQAKSKEDQAKADSLNSLYRLYMWATIIGVGGGLIGVVILIVQARLTRTAANAAKASADALINSERAWVVSHYAKTDDDVGTRWFVRPEIANMGKTIARIRKISCGSSMLKKDASLPPVPNYSESRDFNDYILLPGKGFPPDQITSIAIGADSIVDVSYGRLKFYFYGLVEYLDLAGIERTTRFVLIHVPPQEFDPYLNAPAAYYEAT